MSSRSSRTLLLALGLAAASAASAQSTIAFQGFEPGDSWPISVGSASISAVPGTGDTPAGARIRTGASSFQVSGGTATLDLAPRSTTGFTGVSVTLRVSSTSATTGNGSDSPDRVQVFVSLNGGAFPATPDISLSGGATTGTNARWAYSATGAVSTPAGTPVSPVGASATGPAALSVTVPDGTTSVALRVVALNDNASERWNVDDVVLAGTPAGETAAVSFSPATGAVVEGGGTPAAFSVVYTLAGDDGIAANNPAVSGSFAVLSGSAADIALSASSYSFAGGAASPSGSSQPFSVTAVDDAAPEATETVVLEFGPVAGGTGSGTFTVTVSDNDAGPVVQFTAASAEAGEGDGSITIGVSLSNPSATVATLVDVVLTSGDPADVGGVATTTVTFPPGSTGPRPVTVTITDDARLEARERFIYSLQNPRNPDGEGTGTIGPPGTFTFTIIDNEPVPNVRINEVDVDTPGADTAEFIELVGPPGAPLDAFVLVGFNGGNSVNPSYFAFELTGQTIGPDSLFVLCGVAANVPGCDLDVTPNADLIQQGDAAGADAVVLYVGAAAAFPPGTPPTTADRVDALVYNATATALGGTLAAALGEPVQFLENYNGLVAAQSLGRIRLASNRTELFYAQAITPGLRNRTVVTVNRTSNVAGVAGYRLFSAPVVKANGASRFNVDDLARINLVQDVAGGTDADGTYSPQYPAAPGPNLFLAYAGGGTAGYVAPATTADDLNPGAGFFWQLYNLDLTPTSPAPYGVGTSASFAVGNPLFQLALTGVPLENPSLVSPYTAPFTQHADGFYLLGNPFAYPLSLSGITPSAGSFQTTFQAFDGTSYVAKTAGGLPAASNTVAPWQGFFAESATLVGAGTPFDVRYTSDAVVPTLVGVDLVGRPAGEATGVLALVLDGRTADGRPTHDEAALVQFLDGASAGWDAADASKLVPPAGPYALLAPVGTRDGAPRRQAVLSLPGSAAAGLHPLAFAATHAGTYTLTADLAGLPTGWTAELRDLATGTVADLAVGYTFTADATDWTDRFALVLRTGGATSGESTPTTVRSLTVPRPNPTASRSTLTLRLAAAEHVTATVVDALGRTVATLYDAEAAAGADVTLAVDASRLAPGVYVVRVQGTTFAETRRLTVVR